MSKCVICQEKELTGRQKKFCSDVCKQKDINNKHQNYAIQQKRGADRRKRLIISKGGKCEKCGYCKNYAALTFHHLDPSVKEFGIDLRKCSNSTWESLVEEVSKCQLVCHNCHNEIHHPDCLL